MLALVSGPDVLHVGCVNHEPDPLSPRWIHGRLLHRFPDAVGLDIDAGHIAELERMGYRNLTIANAETFDLGRRFDTILAGELIEHLSNPGAFLARCHAHLKPGGRVILSTPFPFSLAYSAYALAKYPKTCSNAEHTTWYCPATLGELARREGFRIDSLVLTENYNSEIPSRAWRTFVRALRLLRPVIPHRLMGNSMVALLTPA